MSLSEQRRRKNLNFLRTLPDEARLQTRRNRFYCALARTNESSFWTSTVFDISGGRGNYE